MTRDDDNPCATCIWHFDKTGYCAAFGMTAPAARNDEYMCGARGRLHREKPSPWAFVESWWFIGLMLVIIAIIAGLRIAGLIQ